MNGAVFKRDNVEVHKFLKFLTQGNKSWKWIEKSKRGRDAMKSLRGDYNESAKGEYCINISKAYLKELYFKHQDVFLF